MKKDIAFGGVTRVPGGAVSSDGDLCAAVDVCNDGMGIEMLEKPTMLFELADGEDLLCIHEPEGEGKHYITQWIYTAPTSSTDNNESDGDEEPTDATEDADDLGGEGESDGEGDQEPAESTGPAEPAVPTAILNGDTYASQTASDIAPYTLPDVAESSVSEVFSTWHEANKVEDSGGTSYLPASAGTSATTTTTGIYLCYWAWDEESGTNGAYVREQVIDITPYGKVTAIQPMGNTLICNHEGGENFPKEIRYWLWKAADEAYLGLGSKPPMINITFGLNSTFEFYPKKESTFDDPDTPTKYSKYGGVTIDSYPYTDTMPLFWSDRLAESWVPPLAVGVSQTNGHQIGCNFGDDVQSLNEAHYFPQDGLKIEHFPSSYSIENIESPDGKTDVAGMKVNWTTMALGAYNKFIAEQNKDNKFVFPFYARYSYEMYDGSLIMHSYPVLMIPNSRGPIFALDGKYGLKADLDDGTKSYEKVKLQFNGRVYGFSSKLMYDLKALSQDDHERLENWKDLIRGINIYITPPIYNYKQGGQVLGWRCMSPLDPINNITNADGQDATPWNRYYTIGKVNYSDNSTTPATPKTKSGNVGFDDAFKSILPALDPTYTKFFWPYDDPDDNPAYFVPDYLLEIPQKEEIEVIELHENAGQFYKFAEIAYEKLVEITDPEEEAQGEQEVGARKKVLTTISNQDVMQDDNGSHDTMSADVLYAYNRRLNMANVNKIMHSPLQPSVQWARDYGIKVHAGQTYDREYPYQVTIYAKNGAEIARLKCAEAGVNTASPQYIFYPNTNAFEALITRGEGSSMKNYKVRLKEHKALNGAFWLADFLNTGYDLTKNNELTNAATADDINLPEANTIVDESNKIYTSETDNPFFVPFGNINIAGGGEVRALAAATTAMSQGQFGQHPMYCFTSEGVWAMTVGDTGGWATIQPVTRDVISEHTMPLSLDSTVVFLTERGLLQLAGAQIKVLSDVLQGTDPLLLDTPNFGLHRLDDLCGASATNTGSLLSVATSLATTKFPEQAWMAYDYDNARIYVTPQNGGGSWVYNLKSQIWTQASTILDRQIVSYPECEQQCGGKVVRISVDRAVLSNLCSKGLVISRPIKLADMGLLKRWREIAVRGRFKPYSTAVQVALWGTRDWIDHALVASSTRNRLTRWSGSPYFGHSVALFLTKPNYAMQVAGMDIDVDAEHDNKLR